MELKRILNGGSRKKRRTRTSGDSDTVKIKIFLGMVLLIVATVSIYFGEKHLKANQIAQAAIDKQMNAKFQENKQKSIDDEINKWKPNGSPRSYIDDLNYLIAKNGHATISTLGSSVTAGAGASSEDKKWSSLLENYLIKTKVISNGFGGYSSSSILSENKADIVISQKPDIVLFETCILNDHGQSVPIEKTIQNITEIIDKIQKNLPESKIILISPNPKLEDKKNTVGLTMADYASKTKEFIISKGWNYIDVYSEFQANHTDNLKSLLTDGIHPNDSGYKIWFEGLKKGFEKKI